MTPKHIIVFLTDDHGQWAANCYGNADLHTPSMDFLAGRGARFDHAFTPCPVCSPARASFWTGKIPSAHGIHDHVGNREHPGITGHENLGEVLQQAGYRTALCGKWHGHAHGDVVQPGFDFWYSQWGGTNAKFGKQPFSDNGERVDHHGHQAPIVTDAALRFLDAHQSEHADRPFFLFVGYTETHSPFSTLPERLVAPHREHPPAFPVREEPVPAQGPRNLLPETEDAYVEHLAQYFASVEMIDENIGRVLDALEGHGILDDTLIVYTSDHGHMNGQHGLLCKGNATTPQNFFEESIRIPLLVKCPGAATGRTVDAFVDHCDLYATLRDYAGAGAADDSPGESYLPHLLGEPSAESKPYQICEYGNARMIRTRDGKKLIRRYPGPNGHFPDEFYDRADDPGERTNRYEGVKDSDRVRELDAEMERYFARYAVAGRTGLEITEDTQLFNPQEPWRREVKQTQQF